ncbi:MAG: hypothetical protein IJH25_00235 [Clostridia bacterium]|nr:hypothetical protein [Clostridia bacterium]
MTVIRQKNTPDDNDQAELEFSNAQLERIDEIHNAVYDLCAVLTENANLEWDMAYIGEIADLACDVLTDSGFRIRYPAIITDEDGSERIVDFHNDD